MDEAIEKYRPDPVIKDHIDKEVLRRDIVTLQRLLAVLIRREGGDAWITAEEWAASDKRGAFEIWPEPGHGVLLRLHPSVAESL